MRVYEPLGGEWIFKTVRRMIRLANKTKEAVRAKHNDIKIVVRPSDSFDYIIFQWFLSCYKKDRKKAKRKKPTKISRGGNGK